jgi:hypothetical protein
MTCAALLFATGVAFTVGTDVAFAASAPSVTTGAASSIRPTAVLLSARVDPDGLATSWYFEYGQSTIASYQTQTPAKGAGASSSPGTVKETISGLEPATSYRFRIVAVNRAGKVYGSAEAFNTTAAPAVVTGAASAVTVSAATLNGVVNPEALNTSWSFDYGTTPNFGLKTPVAPLAASPNNTNVGAAITALAPDTTYYYRIVATSSAGTTLGIDLTFTTGRSVSMNASMSIATYGNFVTLSGAVASGAAGQHVTISSEQYGATVFSNIADVATGAAGKWSFRTQPTIRTTFEAIANGGTSSAVVISVRPVVYLTKAARGRLTTRVIGAISFASHVLQLQRLSKGLWVTWKSVRLNRHGKSTFSTSLPKGKTSIRMAIGPFVAGANQAAPGYLAGFSRIATYTRG